MNFFVFAEAQATKARNFAATFLSDVSRLLKASPVFGGAVVASGIALGIGPALWWQFFARFIDAAFASRGVGTVTSDLTYAAVWIVVLALAMSVAFLYVAQTKALARQIARIIIFTGIIVTHAMMILPVTKAFLIFLAVLVLALHVVKRRPALYAIMAVTFLLAISTVTDVLYMMTRRSMTVGSMLEYSGCIIGLSLIVAYSGYRQLRNNS
jgi:hypothetical protein